MELLAVLLRMCPFHRPTLEYVLASPIAMAFSSCLSIVENDEHIVVSLLHIHCLVGACLTEGVEFVKCGKRMMQALLSSDVGNAVIAGADEQILGSPPIVQKWIALLETLLVYLAEMECAPHSHHSPAIHNLFEPEEEPFLNIVHKSELSFEEKSAIYCSLVSLVKEEYPFDKTLQDRAAQFLKILEPKLGEFHFPAKLVTDLVPSSAGSPSGFVESIFILLSSHHSTVVVAALSFLHQTAVESSRHLLCRLVESDLVTNVFTSIQPHTLIIPGNETMFNRQVDIINFLANLALPRSLEELGITATVDTLNHREMIFRKVVLPSSEFVTFLISNRCFLNGDVLSSFMSLLATLLRIGPFHRPTLEIVLTSPIVMAFSCCLSCVEDDSFKWRRFTIFYFALQEWKRAGPEVSQSGIRMMQALFSEGFEDTLELMVIRNESGNYGRVLVNDYLNISQQLGLNAKRL
ncbi:hypothetical protein BLNAU_20882 [Blattamonas nauphoetae]|uniref:Uncharacterized protein n=1 Tax=Blattamonas nauphoetae TaxID=2049346 RepID=A0ABQ9WXH7_9EUKA|nr:hypothetical protein BLNAU_20882 [Blattamonas nauphoetae]